MYICFLLNTSSIFRATVKSLQHSLHPAAMHGHTLGRRVL